MLEEKPIKVTVLMNPTEFERFDGFCKEMGYKKSPLVARLIRDFLNSQGATHHNPADDKNEKD